MSDETTPGPAFPLRDRIGAALTTACPEHSHCNLMGPAVWAIVQPELDQRDAEIKRLRRLVADYENGITWHTTCLSCAKLLDSCYAEAMRAEKAEARLLQIESAQDPNNPYWRLRSDRHEATVARVKALAEDMRTWCSPHGIAVMYAQRIDEAIEPPERDHDALLIGSDTEAEFAAKLGATLRRHRAEVHPERDETCGNCAVIKGAPEVLTAGLDDLPAVRAFADEHDPRGEAT